MSIPKVDYRGSRKHILDWLETGREAFSSSLTSLIKGSRAVVTADDEWMPGGYEAPIEARLDRNGLGVLTPEMMEALAKWWLVHRKGANVPNWDLAASCTIDDRKGLVLIEAKANRQELKTGGKTLDQADKEDRGENADRIEKQYKRRKSNHDRIGEAIEEARAGLDIAIPGIQISRDSHYQLSNRIGFAWKLATFSIPVVLVYLGFVGDEGIRDAGEPFRDDEHWQNIVCDYMRGVLPTGFSEQEIACGEAATIQFLIRSKAIREASPPKSSRR
jgi:hypothetical protein